MACQATATIEWQILSFPSSYRIVLERRFKSEVLDNKHLQIGYKSCTREFKTFRDLRMAEFNQSFGALQQSYKLLKDQNDDLVDECGKLRTTHLEQLGSLEAKLKNIDAQHAQILRQRDKEAVELKVSSFVMALSRQSVLTYVLGFVRSKSSNSRPNCSDAAAAAPSNVNICQTKCLPTSRIAAGVRSPITVMSPRSFTAMFNNRRKHRRQRKRITSMPNT